MPTLAVIPARYGSTRFPGKPLADLCGKPLVVHVAERASEAGMVDDVVVATDDERIATAAETHGFKAVMTPSDCPSGSDRIAEVANGRPDCDIIVNVQGDEPLMPPSVIDNAVAVLKADGDVSVATAMIRLREERDFLDSNVVKVVTDKRGRALYFSRSPVPALVRASAEDLAMLAPGEAPFRGFKHFGLYAYRREALLEFVKLAPTPLESIEKLEQLRFLENGHAIAVVETTLDSIGVDTPEDLEAARRIMAESH
ncbi:MAG: 3-deoxy-manno-octulosonate cytidylyltransferase [Candidatus Sumerlaeota bacterium]